MGKHRIIAKIKRTQPSRLEIEVGLMRISELPQSAEVLQRGVCGNKERSVKIRGIGVAVIPFCNGHRLAENALRGDRTDHPAPCGNCRFRCRELRQAPCFSADELRMRPVEMSVDIIIDCSCIKRRIVKILIAERNFQPKTSLCICKKFLSRFCEELLPVSAVMQRFRPQTFLYQEILESCFNHILHTRTHGGCRPSQGPLVY